MDQLVGPDFNERIIQISSHPLRKDKCLPGRHRNHHDIMLLHECGELAEVGADQWLAVRSDLSCEFGSAAQMYSAGEYVQ